MHRAAAADAAGMAGLGSVGVAAGNLAAAKANAVASAAHEVVSAGYAILTNPVLLLILLASLGLGVFWMPYNNLAFEGGQIVWTNVVRPIARDYVMPFLDAVGPVYERVASWWNFVLSMIFKNLIYDGLTLFIRCKYFWEFVRVVLRSAAPIGRGLALAGRMLARAALHAEAPPIDRPQIAVGLIFNATGRIADAATNVTGCYCAFVAYYIDMATLYFFNANVQCLWSNALGLVLDGIAAVAHVVFSVVGYIADLFLWVFCFCFRLPAGCSARFPWPDLHEILPDLDSAFTRVESIACCAFDWVDDAANTALDTAIDVVNEERLLPGLGNITMPGFIKFTAPYKALFPVAVEATRVVYSLNKNLFGMNFSRTPVDLERLEQVTAQVCVELTNGAASFGPRLGHVVIGAELGIFNPVAATFGIFNPVTSFAGTVGFTYGPGFINHTCLAGVALVRGIVDIAANVRTYRDYQDGKYLDCFLRQVRDASRAAEDGTNELYSLIPAWRPCTVTPTKYDEHGNPYMFGFPRVTCPESALHDEMGKTIAFPGRLASAILDYSVSLTEHLDSLDDFRRVPTDCIWDEISRSIRASAMLTARALDQIPDSVFDVQLATNMTANVTGEYARWLIPWLEPLIGHVDPERVVNFMNEIANDTTMATDWIPFTHAIIHDPHLGRDRHLGVMDLIPTLTVPLPIGPLPYPVATVRTLPYLTAEAEVMLVEIGRFLAGAVHYGDYSGLVSHGRYPTFPVEMYERLLRQEYRLADELGYSASVFFCQFHELVAGSPEYAQPPDCKFFVNVSAINFTLCPLNLLPCPKETIAHVTKTLERLINLITVDIALYPRDYFMLRLLDPTLCELETSSYELQQMFEEWNFTLDVPYWHTHLEVDMARMLGGTAFGATKLLVLANKLLVETFRALMRGNYTTMPECVGDADAPSYDVGTMSCVPCTDEADPAQRCPEGFYCCPSSGRCSDACFDEEGMFAAVDDATGSWMNFVDAISGPLKVLDPTAFKLGDVAGKIPAQILQTLFRFLFASARVPRGEYRQLLPEFTCPVDSLGEVIGRFLGLNVAIAGRFMTMMIELGGAKNASGLGRENMEELVEATADMFRRIGTLTAETAGVPLTVVGTLLDTGQMSSAQQWFSEASEGLCRMQNATMAVPVGVQRFVKALDVTGNNYTCEVSRLVGATLNVTAEITYQMINLVGTVTNSTYLGRGIDLGAIIGRLRQLIKELGSTLSIGLYRFLEAFVRDEDKRKTLWGVCDSIGLIYSAILNIGISFLESLVNLWSQVLAAMKINAVICGSSDDTFEIIAPPLRAFALYLNALGKLFDYFIPAFGDMFRTLSRLIATFLDPGSFVHKLVVAVLDVYFSFIRLIVAFVTWDHVKSAAEDFGKSILTLLKTLWSTVLQVIDVLLFGGEPIAECIFDFWDCLKHGLKDLIKSFFTGKMPKNSEPGASVPLGSLLALVSYAYAPDDSCREYLRTAAATRREYELSPPPREQANSSIEIYYDELRDYLTGARNGPAIDLYTRARVAICAYMHLSRDLNDTRDTARAAPQEEEEEEVDDRGCDGDSAVCRLNAVARAARWVRSAAESVACAAVAAAGGHDDEKTVRERTASVRRAELGRRFISTLVGRARDAGEGALLAAFRGDGRRARMAMGAAEELVAPPTPTPTPRRLAPRYTPPSNATVGNNLTADECGHTIDAAFDQLYPDVLCSDTCPNCTDPAAQFTMPSICPITSCPGLYEAHPELIGICTRLCQSAYHTDTFALLCEVRYWFMDSGDDWGQVWLERLYSDVADEGGFDNLTLWEYDVILDEDRYDNETDLGDLRPSDLCTNVGRYGYPTKAYCTNKCATTSSSSLLYRVTHAITPMSAGALALLRTVCTDFCRSYDPDCLRPRLSPMPCAEDPVSAVTCQQICDLEWSGEYDYTELQQCTPTTLACTPLTEEEEDVGRSCVCQPTYLLPMHPGHPEVVEEECMCEYDVGYLDVPQYYDDGTRLPFGCPLTFRDPVSTWIALSYSSVSSSLRPWRDQAYSAIVTRSFAGQGALISWGYASPKLPYASYPLNGLNSTNLIVFTTTGTQCANGTAPAAPHRRCDDEDVACDLPPSSCAVTEECDDVSVDPQTVAVYAETALYGGGGRLVSWTYPVDMTVATGPCFDTGLVGWCHSSYCSENATWASPWPPSTCDRDSHCARGLWCPRFGHCTMWANATFTSTYEDDYVWSHHRVDYAQPIQNLTVRVCRNVTRCRGPDWCTSETIVPNNSTGQCPANSSAPYLGTSADGLPTWELRRGEISCLNMSNATGGPYCETIKLCATIRACYGVPGCANDTSQSCAHCDECPGCAECVAGCQVLRPCSNVTICVDASSPLNVTVCTANGTNVSCHSAPDRCGPWVVGERQVAACASVTEDADGYPRHVAFSQSLWGHPSTTTCVLYPPYIHKPPSTCSPFPMVFTATEPSTCGDPFVHQGDLCSYLCMDNATGAEGDCSSMFFWPTGTIDCDWAKALPTGTYLHPAALKWFCQRVPVFHALTIANFPMAGTGIVTYPERVGSIATTTDARACPGGSQYACVMLGPGQSPSAVGRLTDDQCQEMDYWLGATFLDAAAYGPRLHTAEWEMMALVDWTTWLDAGDGADRARLPKYIQWDWTRMDDPPPERSREPGYAYRYAVTEEDWEALVSAAYGGDGGDEEAVLDRVSRDIIGDSGQDTCTPTGSEPCPPRNCAVGLLGAAECDRYPFPPEDLPCPARPLPEECAELSADPCTAWCMPYRRVPTDPEAEWEAMQPQLEQEDAARSEPPAAEPSRAARLLRAVAELASSGARSESWLRTTGHLARTVEAATCATVPGSHACERLGRAMSPRARVTTTAPARSLYDAALAARAAADWLPPVDSIDRSCNLCYYNWSDVARRSCVEDVDRANNASIALYFDTVYDALSGACEAAQVGNGSESILPWSAIIPDLSKLKIRRRLRLPEVWGEDSLIVRLGEYVGARVVNCALGLNVTFTGSAEDEIVVAANVALMELGCNMSFASAEDLFNFTLDLVKNTNLDPGVGDVGALFWILLLSPVGNKCAALRGEYRLPIIHIPVWSPLWVSPVGWYAPLWVPSYARNVTQRVIDREWIVPEKWIVDRDECYVNQTLCIPLTDGCDCSPEVQNYCYDVLGFRSPIDTAYFLAERLWPASSRWMIVNLVVRGVAWATFTTRYLDKFEGVADRADYHDYLVCFRLVALWGSLWVLFLLPFLGIALLLAFRLFLPWPVFIATFLWVALLILAFNPYGIAFVPVR